MARGPGGTRRQLARRDPGSSALPAPPPLLLPSLLLLLGWAAAGGRGQEPLEFPHAVANLAVSGERFLVASGNCWYEVAPSLAWKEEGYCEPEEGSSCGKPVASVNKLLLPFGRHRLLTCWTQQRGVCYVHSLNNRSSLNKLGDELVTYASEGSAAGLLFCDNCSDWSLVVATTHKLNNCFDDPPASIANKAVFLITVDEKRVGEDSQVAMKNAYNLHFEDAFRWKKHFFFPYCYTDRKTEAKMLVARYKENAFEYNSQLLRCGAGSQTKVLSSAYLEQRELWAGIFGSVSGPATPTSTSLCIFALQELLKNAKSCSFSEPSTSPFHSVPQPPDTCVSTLGYLLAGSLANQLYLGSTCLVVASDVIMRSRNPPPKIQNILANCSAPQKGIALQP